MTLRQLKHALDTLPEKDLDCILVVRALDVRFTDAVEDFPDFLYLFTPRSPVHKPLTRMAFLANFDDSYCEKIHNSFDYTQPKLD